MAKFIELQFIAPISNYIFNNANRYILVFINNINDNICINKIHLNKINNINDTIRAYTIGKTIKASNPYCAIKLFEINQTNIIKLLFTGIVDINKKEYANKNNIILDGAPTLYGELRNRIYDSDKSFLDERFYNFDTKNINNKCIIFFMILNKPRTPLIKSNIIKPLISDDLYIYDRYNQNLIKEFIPVYVNKLLNDHKINNIHTTHNINFIKHFCKKDKFADYINFIKLYQPDVNVYESSTSKNFKTLLTRKIKKNYRPIKYEPYINSIIISPVDCRLRGFIINNMTKFKIFNTNLNIYNLIDKPNQIINGSGFMCRICPQDYKRFYIPYAAYLKEFGLFYKKSSNIYYNIMKLESNYFIPEQVKERDYLSVISGNYTNPTVGVGSATRPYPELIDPQPNTKLIYYLIIIGSPVDNLLEFTNKKLSKIKEFTHNNYINRIKPIWFEQGEELGYFKCSGGIMITLFNRIIEFTTDINHYMQLYEMGNKQIDCYIKTNDIIGILK